MAHLWQLCAVLPNVSIIYHSEEVTQIFFIMYSIISLGILQIANWKLYDDYIIYLEHIFNPGH